MAILYFNDTAAVSGAEDADWDTIDNWWTNEACTTQASNLPTSSDSVVIVGLSVYLMVNSGSQPTIVNFTDTVGYAVIGFDITATGLVQTESIASSFTLTGDGIFLYLYGSHVTGDATLRYMDGGGSIGGTATFASIEPGHGLLDGTVDSAVFYNNTQYSGGTVTNNATFNDVSDCYGSVGGDATFNDDAIGDNGSIGGNGTFNDRTYCIDMVVYGEVQMYDYSHAQYSGGATITSGITFHDQSTCSSASLDATVSVVGSPIVLTDAWGGGQVYFVRRSGINGSSILGVV
jgi:hypothetical protein